MHQTIKPFSKRVGVPSKERHTLKVSEIFFNTIQGEGINTGVPAVFLRLSGCTLSCSYCDTATVWKSGNKYGVNELLDMLENDGIVSVLDNGHHLVLTGGSPLLQQKGLTIFIRTFIERFGFKPYIEVENECQLMPNAFMQLWVDCWNNSPKLANGKNEVQVSTDVMHTMSSLDNSWFKVVIGNRNQWEELEEVYLDPKMFRKDQLILMPQGANRRELEENRKMVVQLAIEKGVRYCTREHVVLWDAELGR